MTKMKGILFYPTFYQAIQTLPKKYQLAMYNAIMEYGFNGTVLNCPMNDHQTAIFIAIRAQLDANKAKYEKAVEAGRKGARFGKRGGRPQKLQDSESLIESDFIEIELTESQE